MPAAGCGDDMCVLVAGVVDDVYGVNYVEGSTSGDPYDDNGHGTFVTGVVGAVGNNGVGISGVSQVASMMGALSCFPCHLCTATPAQHTCMHYGHLQVAFADSPPAS